MQAESAKSNNQHNQQNEIPKDYSLLRKFDLEAAKRGELMCNVQGEGKFKLKRYTMNANDVVVEVTLEDSRWCEPRYLRMLPLCWIEGKPVYKGDVLWRKDKDNGEVTQVTVKAFVESEYTGIQFLKFEENVDTRLDFTWSTLHWEKPKVKVQKEGWMNIYPVEFTCGAFVYKTKELADINASRTRIDCVKVQWEVEE